MEDRVSVLEAASQQKDRQLASLNEQLADANDSIIAMRHLNTKLVDDITAYIKGQLREQRRAEGLHSQLATAQQELAILKANSKLDASPSPGARALSEMAQLPSNPTNTEETEAHGD